MRPASHRPAEAWFDFRPWCAGWAVPRDAAAAHDGRRPRRSRAPRQAHRRRWRATARPPAPHATAPRPPRGTSTRSPAAIAIGLQPTVAMLTRVLGRGSASTLHLLLKAFYRRAVPEGLLPGAEAAPAHDVPPAFLALLDQLRATARAEGEAAPAPQRAALAEREAAAEAREAALAADQTALVKEREEVANVEKERARYVSHLEAQLAEATRERNEARNIVAGHEALIHRLEAEAAAAREQQADLAARTAAELARARDEHGALAATEREQLQALARLESERDALALAREDLVDRLAQLQRAATAEREAAERRFAAAEAEAETRVRDQARWFDSHQQTVDDLDRAYRALEEMRSRTDALRGKLETAQSDLAAQGQALAAARAAQSAVQQERDHLATLVSRLGGTPSTPAKGGHAR
ncbi:DNA-binding protein [Rhodanobacter sp. FW106-PBR-LB-2-11]|uniref:DNA-binding protein n=1 Tax=Rhodanobacter sp. FW106-PBR-LB-2-11 TaxID=1524463 RepID=UPI0034E37AEB